MLSHGNIVADCAGAMFSGLILSDSDVHLSYLPLAHMFERIVQAAMWSVGGSVGFYQGNTLKLMEDISVLRPTVFPSVPRLVFGVLIVCTSFHLLWRLYVTANGGCH